jgi:hypothetical protein
MELDGIFTGLIVGEAAKLLLMIVAVVRTNWVERCDKAIEAAAEEDRYLNEAAGVPMLGSSSDEE